MLLLLCMAICLNGCFSNAPSGSNTPQDLSDLMFPYYGDSLVLPPNIAPLNFSVTGKIRLQVFCGDDKEPLLDKSFGQQVRFKLETWKKWLAMASERQVPLRLKISTESRDFSPLRWFVADEPIDPYLVYRLVLPNDGVYNVLGIYQRNLADFSVKSLYVNTMSEGNCMNCHTFCDGNADEMVMHWRFPSEGSLLQTPQGPRKIALPPDAAKFGLRLVYTAYHPAGRYIAFSTNHLLGITWFEGHLRYFNGVDSLSRIVVYDIEKNRLFSSSALWQNSYELTYPAWSPQGDRLYFCRAPKEDAVTGASRTYSLSDKQRLEQIRFDLAYVDFDLKTGRLGDSIQTLLYAHDYNGSFALPRVNPANPNCIAVNFCPCGSWPVGYYGDLGLVFLNAAAAENAGRAAVLTDTTLDNGGASTAAFYVPTPVLNSPEAEGFHNWSHSGCWMVYVSKQQDGYFALPYITYFDGKKFSKPFLLPQKDGDFYRGFQKSFNLPELTVSPSKLTPKIVEKVRHSEPLMIDITEIEKLAK